MQVHPGKRPALPDTFFPYLHDERFRELAEIEEEQEEDDDQRHRYDDLEARDGTLEIFLLAAAPDHVMTRWELVDVITADLRRPSCVHRLLKLTCALRFDCRPCSSCT